MMLTIFWGSAKAFNSLSLDIFVQKIGKYGLERFLLISFLISRKVEEKDMMLTIFWGSAKALNSLSLDIFVQKIGKYGLERFLLISFLISRKQCVRTE